MGFVLINLVGAERVWAKHCSVGAVKLRKKKLAGATRLWAKYCECGASAGQSLTRAKPSRILWAHSRSLGSHSA